MNKYLKTALCCVNSICLIAFLFFLSIQTPAFGGWFYSWQFERNNTAEVLRMDENELLYVRDRWIDFLRGRSDSLADVSAVVRGAERLFFNEAELCHMDDVRVLFDAGRLLRNIAAIGFVITLALLIKHLLKLQAYWRGFSSVILVLFVVLGLLIAVNFDRAFDIFHRMFFVDNWTFDPRTSLMINMLPGVFFQNIAAFILGMFFALLSLLIGVSLLAKKILRKMNG